MNATILVSVIGISIAKSNNIELQDVGLWHNKNGISLTQVVTVNINNVFASGSTYRVFYANGIKSLSVKNLTVVNWTRISLYLLHTKKCNSAEPNDKICTNIPDGVFSRSNKLKSQHHNGEHIIQRFHISFDNHRYYTATSCFGDLYVSSTDGKLQF